MITHPFAVPRLVRAFDLLNVLVKSATSSIFSKYDFFYLTALKHPYVSVIFSDAQHFLSAFR